MNNLLHVRHTSGRVSTQTCNEGKAHLCSVNVLLHAWHSQVINELYHSLFTFYATLCIVPYELSAEYIIAKLLAYSIRDDNRKNPIDCRNIT